MAHETLGVLTRADAPARRHTSAGGDPGDMGALEVALLHRSLAGTARRAERCGHCGRTLLAGERIYEFGAGALRCELCRGRERGAPSDSHLVRGPEFGHSIRVIDRRPVLGPGASARRPDPRS